MGGHSDVVMGATSVITMILLKTISYSKLLGPTWTDGFFFSFEELKTLHVRINDTVKMVK